ncbi:hypothetical protein ACFOVU_16130 [Nocardiopsis sediminis]|uniref:GntR family transcriptional regulator n=1 Tax=Nocardiopsis sediminis TaxID=1778267 RepID=A0ABV8FMT5_9ACTN
MISIVQRQGSAAPTRLARPRRRWRRPKSAARAAPPIREALEQLQVEGVVEIGPRVGTLVRRPSRREVVELFQLKEVLEGPGARLPARRGAGGPDSA